MKNLKFFILLLGLTLLLAGCASLTWHIIKIPRTPENLQAYRECQRTWATATGYDKEGYLRLKDNCVKTIPNITILHFENYKDVEKAIENCERIEGGYTYGYYFCKPE